MKSLAVLALCVIGQVENVRADQPALTISGAWARPTAANVSSGSVYLTITDLSADDRLLAATTPIAAGAGLHRDGAPLGIAKRQDVPGIDVEHGIPLVLAPNGYCIVLTGLTKRLQQGDEFPIMLVFQNAGKIEATVTVHSSNPSGEATGVQ